MTPLFPIAPLESLVLQWKSSMSSKCLLRVSSVRVTKLRRSTAMRLLKIGWRIFGIRIAQGSHDDLVFWVLLENNELHPVLEKRAMGALLRTKKLTIDRVHRGGAGPRSCAPVTASFKPGLQGDCADTRGHNNSAVVHQFQFSVLTSTRNGDKPVYI